MDREKVIKSLEICSENISCDGCEYEEYHGDGCFSKHLMGDALELLKEDCHNCKLECLLQKYDELKEKYDALLKEQGCAKIKEPDCRICCQSHCRYYHESRKPKECKSYIRMEWR